MLVKTGRDLIIIENRSCSSAIQAFSPSYQPNFKPVTWVKGWI